MSDSSDTAARMEAEKAWKQYRDVDMRHWPRRQLRKREFIAGWMARVRYDESLRVAAVIEGLTVSAETWAHIRDRKIIHAIKGLRADNYGLSLYDAKMAIYRLAAEDKK